MKAPKTPVALSQSELLTIYSEYCQYLYLNSCSSMRAGHVSHLAALLTAKRVCVLQMSANTENTSVRQQISKSVLSCGNYHFYLLDNPDSISFQVKYQLGIKVKMTGFRRRSEAVNVKKLLIFCIVLLSKNCFCLCKIYFLHIFYNTH